MVDIISLLSRDGYIMCNKTLIKLYGADCAILVGELCAEYNYFKTRGELQNDNSFYSTQQNIEENTGLNSHYQRKAINTLIEANIISVVKKGMPAKNYYTINTDTLCQLFTGCTTSDSSGAQQVIHPVHINNNYNNNKENNNKDILSKDNISTKSPLFRKPKTKQSGNMYSKCVDMVNEYTNNTELREKLVDYLDLKMEAKKIKYTNHWKGELNKLEELGKGDIQLQIKIVKQSIEKGWINLYEYKDYGSTSNIANIANESKTMHSSTKTERSETKKKTQEYLDNGGTVF